MLTVTKRVWRFGLTMPKKFRVTDTVFIEALGSDRIEDPLVFIISEAPIVERQVIVVFADEIKALIEALTEAAVWLADQVGK